MCGMTLDPILRVDQASHLLVPAPNSGCPRFGAFLLLRLTWDRAEIQPETYGTVVHDSYEADAAAPGR